MSRKPRNPEVGMELLSPDSTRFRATLNHYPTPEGINKNGLDSTALALWASDVWAMIANQPARFFVKGEDGRWRRKTEPAKPTQEIPRQLPGGADLWDVPSSVREEAEHQVNALDASGNPDAAKKLRAMIANGADDDALSVFMALSAGLPDAREEAEMSSPPDDSDPRKAIIGNPLKIGMRGVFEISRLLLKEYGNGPADLFRKTFFEWMHKTTPVKEIRVVGAVMVRDGCVFAARRAPHKSLAGQWEFPGGKVEAGETSKQALAREMHEEFGVKVSVGDWLAHGEAVVDCARIILDVYATSHISGEFVLTDHDAVHWFPADRLDLVLWAEVDRVLLPRLQERLGLKPWPANIIPTAPDKAEF